MVHGIDDARQSLRQHRWHDALAGFTELDRISHLEPTDLVQYASAAWWSGEVDTATDTLERAFGGFEAAGRNAEAAVVAVRLARLAMLALKHSVMGGWIARAERLLEDVPESTAHAWLRMMTAAVTGLGQGDLASGEVLADEALRLARTHQSPDVESLALAVKGQLLLRQGRWRDGLALIEEAAAAATSARMEPVNSCDVYCLTISAFSDLGEYGRAGEWIDEADRWMRLRSISGYRGECRVHRAALKRMRGDWLEAEREAREACTELGRYRMLDSIGLAHYQIGEVRMRLGDLAEAAAAFQTASEHGHPSQPGTALLALAQGKHGQAAQMIASFLSGTDREAGENHDLLSRARLLSAQLEIALANEDLETARHASSELDVIGQQYSCDVLSGLAASAAGALALKEGSLEAATAALRRATRLWKAASMPYEWARARALLGEVLRLSRDWPSAKVELQAARTEFERLGAAPDLARVDAVLGGQSGSQPAPGVTKTFMFTDIVSSTDLAGSLGDSTWQSVMAWHDRALRTAFARHGGDEVRHTGDGFFATFDSANAALGCAVEIQRVLATNRREHGSALTVRIGLHLASALRHEGDYAGQGVHVAARVAALAGRGEIVASRAVFDAVGGTGFDFSEERTASVKGVSEPVEVRTVAWG
ncbi:MAG TPA: adenylate/guanylate cyclase domain-containing protein [Trueperaceae bacterium]|nr:adenylate/guanylate cyclase domain-containing protein [Trueperaceae bacterium]